jgi:aerobic carbon-monoxide dehydrogenase medium subunit
LKPFSYEKVASPVEAATTILKMGPDNARVIAGGTALVIMMKEKVLSPNLLLDISQIQSMRKISYSPDTGLNLGSMVTHLEIEDSPEVSKHYPSLKEAFHTIGNIRVRAVGTIGGNLAYAEPQCNPPAILSALGAKVQTTSASGETRSIPMDDFITGIFESVLAPDEIITAVTIPPPKSKSSCSFVKFTTKSATDKPTSTVAIYIELDDSLKRAVEARIVVGAVGPKTFRCPEAESRIKGSPNVFSIDCSKVAKVASGEFEAMDDLYGPAWYKKKVTESIIRDTLMHTIEAARKRG